MESVVVVIFSVVCCAGDVAVVSVVGFVLDDFVAAAAVVAEVEADSLPSLHLISILKN